jgi:antitoxin component YwqK of YwqJK toxin-antitoxin module
MNLFARAPFVLALSCAIAVSIASCQSKKNGPEISCPSGDQLVGAPPPDGQEIACQKTVNGQPVKDGPMIVYRDSGMKMLEGNFKDGRQTGEWTMWYDNAQEKSVDHYVDGVQQGEHIGWYSNGQISAKGQFKDGQQDGVWKRWDPNGIRNWEETWKDGKRIS